MIYCANQGRLKRWVRSPSHRAIQEGLPESWLTGGTADSNETWSLMGWRWVTTTWHWGDSITEIDKEQRVKVDSERVHPQLKGDTKIALLIFGVIKAPSIFIIIYHVGQKRSIRSNIWSKHARWFSFMTCLNTYLSVCYLFRLLTLRALWHI